MIPQITPKKLYLLLLTLLFAAHVFAQNAPAQLAFNQKQLSVSAIVAQLKKAGYKVSYDADVNMAKVISFTSTTISFDNLTSVLQQQAGI
jgi:hypothetical protein